MKRYTAIVLAAGSGKRMGSSIHKQYMELAGKPVLFYALDAFEKSEVSDIVLVTGHGEIDYCKKEIIEKYGFQKIKTVAEGGKERFHSVYEGLKAAVGTDYVLIHDGARPFVDADMIRRSIEAVHRDGACIVGMPAKDTIKIADREGYAKETPERSMLWQIQTPQTFSYPLILEAYEKILSKEEPAITDDAMAVEQMTGHKIRIIEGSYRNIKITTPEDLLAAEAFLTAARNILE